MTVTPSAPSFESAISQARTFLDRLQAGSLPETDITEIVAALVGTVAGARGFFVVYLTDERSLLDQPQAAVMKGLRQHPEVVGDLLVKNLAMSSAMALHHQRNNDGVIALKSQRASRRAATLIQTLELDNTGSRLEQLQATIAAGRGQYTDFLNRWGYDAEQQQAIAEAIAPLLTDRPDMGGGGGQ
ncbi:MAG: hypothetical protein ACO4CG_12000 [Prochlorothrix sp.]|nr:hypothetical protein [Prochlorothrix sp.]